MKITFEYWQNAKKRALTASYDDGRIEDLRLLEIFDRHGIHGSFHLNSAMLGKAGYVSPEDVRKKYKNHEISAHTVDHPYLTLIPKEETVYQVMEDRRALEALCGYPVRGMSYPFGACNDAVADTLKGLGIYYSRTVRATEGFGLPEKFLLWHPTCHHNSPRLMELLGKFQRRDKYLSLFYVWGHSYEFTADENWHVIEEFCREAAGDPDTWYATNIEICDYVTALRALSFSADRTMVYNSTATDVWIGVDGAPVKLPAGKTVTL